MSEISARIGQIIKSKKISVRSFELSIGASNGMIGRAVSKGSDISASWLSIIIREYPDVNPRWLLTGVGEMLIPVGHDPEIEEKKIEKLTDQHEKVMDILDHISVSNHNLSESNKILVETNSTLVVGKPIGFKAKEAVYELKGKEKEIASEPKVRYEGK